MQKAPIPNDEETRLKAVHNAAILDTKPEERFDNITKEAVKKLRVPISIISILDKDREWYKSCQGLQQDQGDRGISFCGHALMASTMFIVEDTLKDPRFADNPMVINAPYIRFYAGIALHDLASGQPIAVFCIKDTKPKQLTVEEISIMTELAEQAEKELNR